MKNLIIAIVAIILGMGAAFGQSGISTLTNKSGGQLAAGTVVIIDSSNTKAITTTTTADNDQVVGVVFRVVNDNAVALVTGVGNYVAECLVTDTIAIGDYLGTHTVAGRAASNGTNQSGSFAIALETNGAGAGSIAVILMGNVGAGTASDFALADSVFGTFGTGNDFDIGSAGTTLDIRDAAGNSMVTITDQGTVGLVLATGDLQSTDDVLVGDDLVVSGKVDIGTEIELTLDSGGAVTVTNSFISIDTESDDASDTVVNINGGSLGQLLIIRQENDARNLLFEDTAGGNLRLAGDFQMGGAVDKLMLIFLTVWHELSRSDN